MFKSSVVVATRYANKVLGNASGQTVEHAIHTHTHTYKFIHTWKRRLLNTIFIDINLVQETTEYNNKLTQLEAFCSVTFSPVSALFLVSCSSR